MTVAATAVTTPFRFFDLQVARTRRLGPAMVRITFTGRQLRDFATGGRDQRLKLFLPHPYQDAPVVPTGSGDNWFTEWRAMDPAVRAVMRSYTVREQRRDPDEIDIDFALHGDAGPACRWAARARPGDRALVLGPAVEDNGGVDFRPPPGAEWVLITADETALPAVAGILDWLPRGTRAKVWIEVPHAADMQRLSTEADAEITWLFREEGSGSGYGGGAARTGLVLDAVRGAELPAGVPYAWIAGESGTVKALRRHLVRERGFDRRAVKFTGYWRLGATEEDLLAEAVSGAAGGDED